MLLRFFFLFACLGPPTVVYTQADSRADTIQVLTFQKIVSQHYRGWSLQYRAFDGGTRDFVIPLTLAFGDVRVKEQELTERGIRAASNLAFGFGMVGLQKISGGLYANLGLDCSPGVETIERFDGVKTDYLLVRGTAEVGLLWVLRGEWGLTFGASATAQLSNSQVIKRDLGVRVEAGINF